MSPNTGNLLLNEVAPRLHTTVRHQVPAVGSEDTEELTQDAIALAARLLHQAEANGKSDTPGEYWGFRIRLRNGREAHVWGNCDPEGNGPGHLEIDNQP